MCKEREMDSIVDVLNIVIKFRMLSIEDLLKIGTTIICSKKEYL